MNKYTNNKKNTLDKVFNVLNEFFDNIFIYTIGYMFFLSINSLIRVSSFYKNIAAFISVKWIIVEVIGTVIIMIIATFIITKIIKWDIENTGFLNPKNDASTN